MMSLSSSYSHPKPTGGLELWSWVFMRVSGVLLLFLALGHLTLMHLIHNVDEINYAFVAGRYAGWFWRLYDLAMLLLAMLHGTNGARILIDDYLRAGWRRFALGALYLVCGGLTVLGTAVALCFKPVLP
jgi:succinate dehydrogenase / fumarate reductase membrane anchor subunit